MTVISMTGFGRAVAVVSDRRIAVEVRSVNHRGLDVKVRGRNLAASAEVEAIRAVRASCARGSIQVSVEEDGGNAAGAATSGPGPADLSPEHLRALAERLEALRAALGLSGGVDLATVAAFVRLERERSGGGPAPLEWSEIQPALAEALLGLREARSREGAALGQDLRTRAANLQQLVIEIRSKLPPSAERALRRLGERLAVAAAALRQLPEAMGVVDSGRLAQEAAILADRLDVSEEIARLGAHLDKLNDLLADAALKGSKPTPQASNEGVGRPLEFLLQEVGREINTIGTKAQDVDDLDPGHRGQGRVGEDPRAGAEYRVMSFFRRGMLMVISSPSGAGKTTSTRRLAESHKLVFSVSYTTRAPRAGERDGVDYNFVTERFPRWSKRRSSPSTRSCTATATAPSIDTVNRAIEDGIDYLFDID